MNKIDKILYGGFVAAAIGGIVAMLVSVFSAPKQTAEKENAKPPPNEEPTETASTADPPLQIPDGYVGYWVDDDGNKVWVTQEQLDEGLAAAEEKRRQEEEQQAKEQSEKEWWESRQDWIDRFPFEPTHHPEITFDPNAYDPAKVGEWPEDQKDDAYWEMEEMVTNHTFLRRFYESELPYTEEFEQMYDIVKEEIGEDADNPILLGKKFQSLKEYHRAMAKDPEEIRWKDVQRTIQPPKPEPPPSMLEGLTPEQLAAYLALPGDARREMTKELRASRDQEMRRRIQAYHDGFKTETVDITWGEEARELKEGIVAGFLWPDHYDPDSDEPWIPEEQAIAIRDRLIHEIPGEGFLKMKGSLPDGVHKYRLELQPGDPLLIK